MNRLLVFLIFLMVSCSNQREFELVWNSNKDLIHPVIDVLSTNFQKLYQNKYLNYTGSAILLIKGSIEHLDLPEKDKKVLLDVFEKGDILSIYWFAEDFGCFQYGRTNGSLKWNSKYILYNPNQKTLSKKFDSKYESIILNEQSTNPDFYNLIIAKSVD